MFTRLVGHRRTVPVERQILRFGFVVLLFASGCRTPSPPSLPADFDVFAPNTGQVVFFTMNCEEKTPDGKGCNKMSCKADAERDCTLFGSRCVALSHHYSGTQDAGTCTRVQE